MLHYYDAAYYQKRAARARAGLLAAPAAHTPSFSALKSPARRRHRARTPARAAAGKPFLDISLSLISFSTLSTFTGHYTSRMAAGGRRGR